MGHLLGYALDGQSWAEAQAIAEPLTGYWDGRGLYAEAAAWTDRVRLATEDTDGMPPGLGQPRRDLWLFFAGEQAQRQLDSGRLDAAEHTYREILAMLKAQPASPQQQATSCGRSITCSAWSRRIRGRLDEAADWYARSLAISEELGDRPEDGGQLPPARHGRAGPGAAG